MKKNIVMLNQQKKYYTICNKDDCESMQREVFIKQGFTALRTCYEFLVINDLFNNAVQRYNERVALTHFQKFHLTILLLMNF